MNKVIESRMFLVDVCDVYVVCRYVLSPSTGMNRGEMSSDFLHNIPENVDREWNLTNVILRCAQTESRSERLALYEKLLDILSQII